MQMVQFQTRTRSLAPVTQHLQVFWLDRFNLVQATLQQKMCASNRTQRAQLYSSGVLASSDIIGETSPFKTHRLRSLFRERSSTILESLGFKLQVLFMRK
ncbi:Hypothetical_protein [Hexamita inflata]|uniref:Hypothetical_protein n=1 Tax=Hexamita inflata TaxID=28002 RepID=A0AA86NY20_9EUKA|nr:Hypothetical protein HINF_LOCUS14456 [Hexamita inflata]